MRLFVLIFLFSVQAWAQSLYKLNSDLKIYAAGADIAIIHELEKDQLYQQIPASLVEDEGPAFLARKFRESNLQDIKMMMNLDRQSPVSVDANHVLNKLIHNPIAGNNPITFYDEKSNTGFCFGRALFVEKELLKQNVSKDQIFKVFVLGELFNGQIIWDYHVATMYVDHQGRKLMIDSLFDQVYELPVWFEKMNQYALNPQNPIFRIYFAEADKFQARSGAFNSYDLFDPQYRNYFLDLLIWL